ncbi:hypothetical protein JOB18_015330 [Solea senegalensis]|uniref:B30.2/SPRY domain-containing protein n=1 Tax=Solea senegalensis TaxID=28829 RepID=A0AAV6SP25_SOLSE|nr:hypothetical protein JOB18_015330 [Solea senegalensis]
MTQICSQFKEMHDFLRKRKDQIKKELKQKEDDAVQKMSETLKGMETALTESRELEEQVTSALKITDSEKFLKNWTKNNSKMTPEHLFSSIAKDFQVVNSCLSLGPYESHLQFYVWKEMLQVIQPREEQLSLQSTSRDITVSDDGRDLMYGPQIIQSNNCTPCTYCARDRVRGFGCASYTSVRCRENTTERCASALSSSEFTSGQHYWEIEVGKRKYWKVGTGKNYLCFDQQKYVTSRPDTELELTGRPQKIGLYLDCVSAELSFYDAENMTLLHTMTNCDMSAPVKAFIEYKFSKGADHNPLRVCWL